MYIVLAIIAFGLLIAIHEVGHFTAAKLLHVRVNEFAIGMGPAILKKQGKETLYSWRLLPFGGYCAMGEDSGDADDPRSFLAQKRWRRIVILAAGAIANFIAAFIIIVILISGYKSFAGTTLTGFMDGFPNEGEHGLMVGDTILSISGEKMYYYDDISLFLSLAENRGDKEIDLVVRRGNEKIQLNKFPLERREYTVGEKTQRMFGLIFDRIEPTVMEKLKYSGYTAMNNIRLIRVSIAQLFTGAAGIQDLSGPVGIVNAMNDIGQESKTTREALFRITHFIAFIGVNLAVMNMLPIPALDGGRILFIFISWFIEKIIRRRLDPKYEGYIHMAVFVLLIGFMIFTLVNDVLKIVISPQ